MNTTETLLAAAALMLAALAGAGEAIPPVTVHIHEGEFIMGSAPQERELGYRLDAQRKSHASRKWKWFENETRRTVKLNSFNIYKNLVTNADYDAFVKAAGHEAPFVDKKTWDGYNLVHSYDEVERFLWKDGSPPEGRGNHPVVLAPHSSAVAYCRWLGARLPTEKEWEKAARGPDGNIWPWGNDYKPEKLNTYDNGPYDTVPVGSYTQGRSPYGVLDMAGQVFEWTATPAPDKDKFIVKGGSWDDYPGVTRSAAKHGRPAGIKHILIGFRCVTD